MELKRGVTGILRVKNDGQFIERCVESCIGALDQLVVVYNDCSDDSVVQIRKMQEKYPDKIDIYEYSPKVYGTNLSKSEYDLATTLPDDSPHLLCNYYNFALRKAKYVYALKIDADQIYFSEKLKQWCDFCRNVHVIPLSAKISIGYLFQKYLSFYRWCSLKIGRVIPILPRWVIIKLYPAYIEYAKYLFVRNKACISMSGLNVIEEGNLYVPLGGEIDKLNILPPFNGEGDHLIFKISETTRYERFEMPYYNTVNGSSYSVIEEFKHPYRIMFLGFFWTHVNMMRPNILQKAMQIKKKYPNIFIPIEDFIRYNYRTISSRADKQMFRLYQRILFSFIYTANQEQLRKAFYDK